jgi:hypothetical protein
MSKINMSLLGKIIQLKGLSQKGKNRVRENGSHWAVLAVTDCVLFAPNEHGPWLFVSPEGHDHSNKASRWVRAVGDADFIVITQDG